MSNNSNIKNDSLAIALDFGRALDNLIIPIPELIGSCVEAKAVLVDLLDMLKDSEDSEAIENVKFVALTLSLCADFFNDALDERAARHTAAKRAAYLTRFRELLNDMLKNN